VIKGSVPSEQLFYLPIKPVLDEAIRLINNTKLCGTKYNKRLVILREKLILLLNIGDFGVRFREFYRGNEGGIYFCLTMKFKLPVSTVQGQRSFSFGTVGDKKVVAMQGRFHL
jgi:hypothetical protein